eukprot:TRINITY_DN10444_c0_g3_i1.p4 TRINITY_DN10444_c0_g3~~TRINITY_DN10444_c0_g3_i1.p4  ORF type:complete len:123 (-),score=8.84 TRINITY_DN10444_c0_g3_i1:1110-1478(-)
MLLRKLHFITEQIHHHSRFEKIGSAERKSADRSDMLFELARFTKVERIMPGIVRTRRQFINQKVSVFRDEHFHRKRPDKFQFLRELNGKRLCPLLNRFLRSRGHDALEQNIIFVDIFSSRKG